MRTLSNSIDNLLKMAGEYDCLPANDCILDVMKHWRDMARILEHDLEIAQENKQAPVVGQKPKLVIDNTAHDEVQFS